MVENKPISSDMQWSLIFVSHSLEETQKIARGLSYQLRAGDVIILQGDLGAGKTAFVQGLGQELGIESRINSPTFVLVKHYKNSNINKLDLVHVDAYRLNSGDELEDLDLEYAMNQAVTAIEWGAGKAEYLNNSYLYCKFETIDDEEREITIEAFGDRWKTKIQLDIS